MPQFQTHFETFGTLRRRRHELEYPTAQEIGTTPDEAGQACESAWAIIEAAEVLPHLTLLLANTPNARLVQVACRAFRLFRSGDRLGNNP